MDDVQLIKKCCDIMNKVFVKGESLEKTKEELKLSKEETEKWENISPYQGKKNSCIVVINYCPK